jgi:acetyl-CoA carboxylase biotin carboxyl carrier protein
VNVGDDVKPGKVVCIIEAMKLFNEIESEISGKIVKILVDNATPVEYDQPLFLVEPA